jgi:hypothetical protein
MNPNRSIEPSALAGEVGAILTGITQLLMILFPFAFPLLILTVAAGAILALPLVALAMAAALVAAPYLAVRWIWRRLAGHFVPATYRPSGRSPIQ